MCILLCATSVVSHEVIEDTVLTTAHEPTLILCEVHSGRIGMNLQRMSRCIEDQTAAAYKQLKRFALLPSGKKRWQWKSLADVSCLPLAHTRYDEEYWTIKKLTDRIQTAK